MVHPAFARKIIAYHKEKLLPNLTRGLPSGRIRPLVEAHLASGPVGIRALPTSSSLRSRNGSQTLPGSRECRLTFYAITDYFSIQLVTRYSLLLNEGFSTLCSQRNNPQTLVKPGEEEAMASGSQSLRLGEKILPVILVHLWRIIRASFSQERMSYIPEESKVTRPPRLNSRWRAGLPIQGWQKREGL